MTNHSRHILVVDDNMLARMEAMQCVKNLGYSATMASDGDTALELLRSKQFDLILLDLIMPKQDGFSVLQRVQSDEQLKKIPVIVLSGTKEDGDIARCLKLGAEGYLFKPIDSYLLASELEKHLSV